VEVVISGSFKGTTIEAPPSKSVMQRAVAAAMMAEGTSSLFSPSHCNDSLSAMSMARSLGATVTDEKGRVLVTGGVKPDSVSLNAGESGLGVRLFSAMAATCSEWITINGTGTVLKRPMEEVVKYLTSCGAVAESNNGFLPLRVKGPLAGGRAFLDGKSSSQFLTGLLMALPLAARDSHLTVDSLSSRSYVDITIEVMKHFGVTVRNDNYRDFYIPGRQRYNNASLTIEGDWSGGAFLLVAGALGGGIEVSNLRPESFQPDKLIIDCLKLAGSDISTEGNSVVVKPVPLRGFTVDVSDAPDLAPPLVSLATGCLGKSVITGTERLRIKESDRGEALEKEFRKSGFDVTNTGNSLVINGGFRVRGGRGESHGDHRISMALAVAAASSLNGITLSGYEAVAKSYPGFFDDIRECGMKVDFTGEGDANGK
jgi:3-phosphoshikimate 1-carboxyvinyltransferase